VLELGRRTLDALGESLDLLFARTILRSRQPPARIAEEAALGHLDDAARFFGEASSDGRLFAVPAPIRPLETRVRSLADGDVVDLEWPSCYQPLHARYAELLVDEPQNQTCRARWWRHAEAAPALVCLHGWGAGQLAIEERAFAAASLHRRGLDVVLATLPFHARRGRPLKLPTFPSPDPFVANEGFAQATRDLRGLVHWLRHRGAPAVGITGMSLGGFTAALLATVEPKLDFVVPIIPVGSIPDMMWRIGEGTPARRRAEELGLDGARFATAFAAIEPLKRRPAIDPSRVLVVAGARDRVVPLEHAEWLQRHLSSRPLVTFRGSHLVQHGRADAFRALLAHLRELDVLPTRA
jgi:pimeloyl-ACP methyl ester carboxylesterase